ncbi:MAG: L-lactate dehydrogenase [Oscillospiraceae bacterium]|nr:L-lactate dehydrogenase [Oscillospiraceae bacterium]
MDNNEKNGAKITVLGAGNVGATIAYTLAVAGTCSDLVLVDINKDKAEGEAMDIRQGLAFCPAVTIRSDDYAAAADSDIVIVTLGIGRKPGQSRIDLAQTNINIVKSVMPQVAEVAPNAVYIVVSNPVDILTYAAIHSAGLSPDQVIGSGTMLDSSRLRSILAERMNLNVKNVHAYVFGEHGDTSMIPWSLASAGGMKVGEFQAAAPDRAAPLDQAGFNEMEQAVRCAGAEVIRRKGATFYAIALSVREICDAILRDSGEVMTVSSLLRGEYGMKDVCLSLPCIVGIHGIAQRIQPALLPEEEAALRSSGEALRAVIDQLQI